MKNFFTLTFLLISGALVAQVGIGSDNPHASSLLEVKSSDKGFLPPRMTCEERNSIQNPAEGLVVYDTEIKALSFHDGSNWNFIGTDIVHLECDVEDAYIRGEGNSATNYNTTDIQIKRQTTASADAFDRIIFITVDIPQDVTFSTATLELAVISYGSSATGVDLYTANAAIDETTLTFDNQPTVAATSFLNVPLASVVPTDTRFPIDLTTQALAAQANNQSFLTIAIYGESVSGRGNIYFYSSENANESLRPKFTLKK